MNSKQHHGHDSRTQPQHMDTFWGILLCYVHFFVLLCSINLVYVEKDKEMATHPMLDCR